MKRILPWLFAIYVSFITAAQAQPQRIVDGGGWTPTTINNWNIGNDPKAVPFDWRTGGQLTYQTNRDARIIDCSFTRSGAGLVASEAVQEGTTGSGMTVAQAYGNLLIDTGTTPSAEFLMRSVDSIRGGHIATIKATLSQKIVNQHFGIYLADLIGDSVPFTTDATGLLISVTLPSDHGFTAANIGQSCYLGGGVGAAVIVPGRYAITAVTGDVVTFSPVFAATWTRSTTTATVTFLGGNPIFSIAEAATVSASSDVAAIVNGAVSLLTQTSGGITTFACLNVGATSGTLTLTMSAKAWTPNAAGTVTVFGWNCVSAVKNGTSATATWFDTQRKGWASGASTQTTTTDASPGQMLKFSGDTTSEFFSDASPATASALQFTGRASRMESLVDATTPLFLFIQAFNGVSAPATTTRLTIGKFSLEETGINKVIIAGVSQTGTGNAQRVSVDQMPSVAINTAPTTTPVSGMAAAGAVASGNPVQVGVVAATAIQTARTAGQIVPPAHDKNGRYIGANEQIRDLTQMVPMVTLTSTTETTIVPATAAIFNDLRALIITNTSATGTRVDFRHVAAGTVVFSVWVPANTTLPITLPVVARQATVNTAWTAQLGTAVTDVRITAFHIQAN
jgi:hypothetical protein